ncbi:MULTISPECIES: nuclease domain-containing protein [unclassified Pseudoalteromonas]|uniref:nuclease domain-containing protein n=1 Tax=unclassified Pseudoalteromonas TaxID=194690 RepID=UPI00069356CA|nr:MULTISPECIES: nuclease domain-containing protein [unclassified Pseudoalteromonas]
MAKTTVPLHFALEKIYKILNQLIKISNSKINRFENTVQKLNERYESFSQERLIDKNLVRKDLEKLKHSYNLEKLNRSLTQQVKALDTDIHKLEELPIWYIKFGGLTRNGDSNFVGIKTQFSDQWFEGLKNVQNVFLKFQDECHKDLFKKDFEYEVEAEISCLSGNLDYGTAWYTYKLHKITNVKIIGGKGIQDLQVKFMRERDKALSLKAEGWVKRLTPKELTEQQREKVSVQNQINFYQNSYEKAIHVSGLLSPKLTKYKSLLADLKQMGVKPLSTFPNSMTFVQNPDYQAIHSGYKKVRVFANLSDDDLLLSLEKIEEIGLINMPLLYERWCLLQIIKVLVHNYNYVPTEDWKRKLLRIVETGKHNKSIEFVNNDLKRNIKIWYEPTLENGRTPDFVLDVFFQQKQGNQYTKRLVMDAKFYSDDLLRRIGGISKVITELYHTKGYSEGERNAVFMLHPAKNSIPEKVSPQAWGSNTYLGELKMFEWDQPMRSDKFHQYGAVCANPVLRLSYLDELQRLLGMFLQYGIEDNNLQGRPDDVESINFCIACGSHDLKHVPKSNSNPRSSWYECNNCKHFATYNHCHRCDTRLIKNGDYWSYHSQMPMEPLNIKCPKCESLV